ncbi:MAG TPA: PKD domain-containing protein [Thermoplasmatales archaeon]|nr:PKD domain-containing protein [Thermoplasmatales archaeon]
MKRKTKQIIVSSAIIVIIVLSIFSIAITQHVILVEKEAEKPSLFVKIFADKTTGIAPFEVNFTPLVVYYQVNIKYYWDFGDVITSHEQNPSHVYKENGTYLCKLKVTDNKETSEDYTEIVVTKNKPPAVTILVDKPKSSRPWKPGTIILWSKWADYYYGRTLRQIIEFLPNESILLNLKGFVYLDAQVVDPEGDEIVSYTWEIIPHTYTTITGQQKKPVYVFKEKNLTVPLLYMYGEGDYDVKLTVEDSAGNTATNTLRYTVDISPQEATWNTFKLMKNNFRNNIFVPLLSRMVGPYLESALINNLIPLMEKLHLPLLIIMFDAAMVWIAFRWNILDFTNLTKMVNIVGSVSLPLIEKYPSLRNFVNKSLPKIEEWLKEKNLTAFLPYLQQLGKIWGLINLPPELSNELPENRAKMISTDIQHVTITVEDAEGDPFDVYIMGDYVNDAYFANQHNGTFNATLITPLPSLSDVYWHVNIHDSQGRWINETYCFRTW